MGQAEESPELPLDPPKLTLRGKTGTAIIAHIGQGALPELLAQAQLSTTKRQQRQDWRRAITTVVFAYYTAKTGQQRSILTEARERMVCLRLEEGHDDPHALLYAIDGLVADDYVMGRSERSSKVYATPELLFRNWGQVEKYAQQRRGFNENVPHPLATKHGIPEAPKEGK